MRSSPETWAWHLSDLGIFQLQQDTEKAAGQDHPFCLELTINQSDSCRLKARVVNDLTSTAWGSLVKAELRWMFCLPLLLSASLWLMCGRGEAFASFCKGRRDFQSFWNGKWFRLILKKSNAKWTFSLPSVLRVLFMISSRRWVDTNVNNNSNLFSPKTS